MMKPEDEQCPVCGYYCLGNGGYACIDKPSLVKKRAADRIEELESVLRQARENLYSMVDPALVAKIDEVLK